MANHISSLKRIRQNKIRNLRNRSIYKSTRRLIKKIKTNKDDKNYKLIFSQVISMIDKLAKKNIIHKNKASRLKHNISINYNKN